MEGGSRHLEGYEAMWPALSHLLDEVGFTGTSRAFPPDGPPLVHMIPDENLDFSHYDICSMYMARLMVDAAHARRKVGELQRFVEFSGMAHMYSGARGKLWRAFVLRSYEKGTAVEYRDLQQPGSSRRARVNPAAVIQVASRDEVKEGKRRVYWREPPVGGEKPFSFLRLPGELCVITTQSDNLADNSDLKEALTVLIAAAEGAGKEPQLTWIVPRPEFGEFKPQQLKLDAVAAEAPLQNVKQRVMTPEWPVEA